MAAYLIAEVRVTDPEKYARYTRVTPGIIAEFGGRFIVRGGAMEVLEGPGEPRRMVVIEFPSMERARAFYHSPQYAAARALRAGVASASFTLVEGC